MPLARVDLGDPPAVHIEVRSDPALKPTVHQHKVHLHRFFVSEPPGGAARVVAEQIRHDPVLSLDSDIRLDHGREKTHYSSAHSARVPHPMPMVRGA